MPSIKILLLLTLSINFTTSKLTRNVLDVDIQSLTAEFKTNFDTDQNGNNFLLRLNNTSLIKNRLFFLILESENSDFVLSILNEDKKNTKGQILMDLTTFSGNLVMAMSDTFFNTKFDFFKDSGIIKFKVSNKAQTGDRNYRVRIQIANDLQIPFGKTYTTRTDMSIKNLQVTLNYNGLELPDLQKLRFQVTSVRQKTGYMLSASIGFEDRHFELNTIFPKTVGGILSLPMLPVCKNVNCLYSMQIEMSLVKVINIETYLIGFIEKLSISHYEEYYDRVYENNKITFYELPFEESMLEMDITINLIPVVGTTGLYVNVRTLPLELENFDWKEKGPLAKRITIKWSELVQMRGEKSNLFIAVSTTRPGEYLLKIDAHDPGYKGRLSSGIIESGFVQFEEFTNYLYFFEVYETQDITFSVSLNVISGDANLYLKQCFSYSDCLFDNEMITNPNISKLENSQTSKIISHTFTCEHNPKNIVSNCQFVIGLTGKENHGTHYEITLHEMMFHRLMIPGHSIPLNLDSEQKVYMKFSHPSRSDSSKLFLSVEALWGSFSVTISKENLFPIPQETNSVTETFVSTKLGLYNSLKNILIDPKLLGDVNIQGIYYIAIIANTSCSINLKFYEKNDEQITIHTLVAGKQVRGELKNANEIAYFTIKISLEKEQANSVSVYLTPVKGQFILFANKNGKLPTIDNKEFYSMDNHLELSYQMDENTHDEYIIGVKLNSEGQKFEGEGYQFIINLSYPNKALNLSPGVITQYLLSNNNYFDIEVTKEITSLLVLKSIVDGYTIKMCAWFTFSESPEGDKACEYNADDKNVSIYVNQNDIQRKCNRESNVGPFQKCFLQIKVDGSKNQKFAIGFTYNDLPFQLTRNVIVTGPMLTHNSAQINFILHADSSKPMNIYFNSKGRDINFFTKIVRGDHFDDQNVLNFPNDSSHDKDFHKKSGYITNAFYNESTIADYGSGPEILISLRSAQISDQMFDPSHNFILQASTDSQEILRTQTHTEYVIEENWNYYTFYNNGNSDNLRIYVSTSVMTRLEVQLSKGLQSRPPFTNKALASKVGIGSIELNLDSSDLKLDPHSSKDKLKGHYTVGVKSSGSCKLDIFWNNKDDLNYVEITPNQPTTMSLDPTKNFYFSFYAKDVSEKLADRGIISINIKTNVQANVYVIKTQGELEAPSNTRFSWKGSVPNFGGITMIQINPEDPEYCVECLYVGGVENQEEGQISILANVRHSGVPIELTPGFTFPDLLRPKEKMLYKIFNDDAGQIDLSISMISGFIALYISPYNDVSEIKFEESFLLENHLDVHKFIPIIASKYNINGPHEFFILIVNSRQETASFTMTIDKNSIKSPIEPGITKFLHLGPSETTDFIYTPRETENTFEVRLELRQVLDDNYIESAMDNISQFASLFHIDDREDKYLMRSKKTSISGNKIFISYDISGSTKGSFAIHLINPLKCPVALTIDLLNGGYKLLNFNQFTVDRLRKGENILYEGYGNKSKYVFIDLKMCHGEVELDLFQSDFQNVGKQNSTEFKKMIDSNSMVHYAKLEHDRLFLRVRNKRDTKAIYEISVFNERDLDNNPYSEVGQGNNGKVEIELDNGLVIFSPISITSTYSAEFRHVVNYTLVLSNDPIVLNYGKNCGRFMIEHVWKDYHMLTFSTTTAFTSMDEVKMIPEKIKIKIDGLIGNTKYHGIVVARIDLFPKNGGYVSPTRSGKVYYDEFVFITSKYDIPFNLWISIIICVGFFMLLFCIVKSYLFGSINQMRNFERLSDLNGFDEGILGMNIISVFEREYYGEEPKAPVVQKADSPVIEIKNEDPVQTIEMSEAYETN